MMGAVKGWVNEKVEAIRKDAEDLHHVWTTECDPDEMAVFLSRLVDTAEELYQFCVRDAKPPRVLMWCDHCSRDFLNDVEEPDNKICPYCEWLAEQKAILREVRVIE